MTSTPSTPSGITDPVELLQRIATTAGEVQRQGASVSADRLKPLVVELDDAASAGSLAWQDLVVVRPR